jgi:uncharacterized membrane protein YdjX (TVP38/TMEM64 family)
LPDKSIPVLRLALFAALLAAALVIFFVGGRHLVSLQSLAENRMALKQLVAGHLALSILAYVLIYALVVVLMFPAAAAMTLTGGFLFGWAAGTTLTFMAATAGATVSFLLARTTLGEVFARRAGGWLCRLRDGFQKDAFSYLLFLRLVPAFPFWFMNLAPALLGMKLHEFILATALGILPGTLAFSVIGSGLDHVLARQYHLYLECRQAAPVEVAPCRFDLNPEAFATPQLIGAFVLMGIVALLPLLAKRLWKSRASRA